jgi:transposase
VYGWDTLVLLKHLLEEGLPKTAIAERVGVDRRTIHRWLADGILDQPMDSPAVARQRPARATKLAPYVGIIGERLTAYPELSAVRLFAECQAAGYVGSYTQLKQYVRQVRPRPVPEPVVRFETPPGHQLQVDFAEECFPWGKRYALVVVLGYSRLLWLRFYPRQTMLTLIRGLEEAFAYFGGVAREALFDQLKAVIIDDQRATGGPVLKNPEFLRFAAHWSFRIRACRPYRAQTKGKVERPIYYVRDNFLYGREFLGDEDLDAQRLWWLDEVANVRVHGTTKEVPRLRFERDERAVLQPLAARLYEPLVLPATRQRAGHQPPLAVPQLVVERRPLRAYTALVEGVA